MDWVGPGMCQLTSLGRLAFFVSRLGEQRHQNILEYGVLAQLHRIHFHEKWILPRASHESEVLTASECCTDLGSVSEKLKNYKPSWVDQDPLLLELFKW